LSGALPGVFGETAKMSGLPVIEECGDGFGTGVLELLLAFGVEKFAVSVDYRKSGNTSGDRDVVLLRDVDVFVHVADVDVDEDEMFREKFGIGTLVIIDVEDLAVAAPVAAKVEDDALVLATSLSKGGGDVGGGVGGFGVEILVDLGSDDLRGSWPLRHNGQCEEREGQSRKEHVAVFRNH